MADSNLLTVNNLTVNFASQTGTIHAVRGISFSVKKGETLGIVGGSGSGKSVTALAIMGLLPLRKESFGQAATVSGEIFFTGKSGEKTNLTSCGQRAFQQIRGKEIAMIFQDPMSALNPVFRCGEQVGEAVENANSNSSSNSNSKAAVLLLFEQVKLPDPDRIYRSYPHQLSGGQRQRVMIAMALAQNPSLLIADEPTSSLDASVERSILDLLKELKTTWGGTLVFISHDLSIVAEMADRVLVMQHGEVVESGEAQTVFRSPAHVYTRQLMADYRNEKRAVGRGHEAGKAILRVENLTTLFPARKNFFGKPIAHVRAVDGVSFEIFEGETLGLVGESGSGKTTLGRSLLHLQLATSGEVFYLGKNLTQTPDNQWKTLRKDLQIIFQDPYSSLNPRQPVGMAITEPMRVHGIGKNEQERRQKALALLEEVGLDASHFWRFPNAFSGGQRQRVCIARALALEPKFIVCDECVSALDVTVQAQVLDLLARLQTERNLTYLFISHDLKVVRRISDRVAIMEQGKLVLKDVADCT